jgi:peptide/nickel transport system permease protein
VSQIQPAGLDEAAQSTAVPLGVQRPSRAGRRGRIALPLWLRLLLSNPKSRGGLVVIVGMLAVAAFAPLLATHDPTAYSLLDAKQSPSWHHFFGTTDQGTDIWSQVVWGTRNSLFLGAAAATLATVLAASLGILAAYSGGWVDDVVNFATNVFLVIPTIPLLIVASAYLKHRGALSMILILGLTLWAFEARILRAQALTLRNRDFILAAKVAGEPTWRIVVFELMPNMISRIAAAFVLVFYISTGHRSTRRCCRASGGRSSSRASRWL